MKKLFAVAVAVFLAVSPSHAGFDYFSVIEKGSGEATVGYADGEWSLMLRYSPVENLEIFGANGAFGLSSDYALGVRYQFIPMLSGFVDIGVPTMDEAGNKPVGFTPGLNFTTNITDAVSLGTAVALGIDINRNEIFKDGGESKKETALDLLIGAEVDFTLTEQICLWLAVDFVYENVTTEGDEYKLDIKDAVQPSIGVSFSGDKVSLNTMVGLNLNHIKGYDGNGEPETTVGVWGGVEFTVGF